MNLEYSNIISQLSPETGITVKYMKIPIFMRNLLPDKDISDFTTKKDCRFDHHDFKIRFMSQDEIDQVNRYKSMKKQVEWIAGRFLVKNMVREFVDGGVELSSVQISYKEEGKPFLEQFLPVDISITHSGSYAAAALCTTSKKIGLDIERSDYLPDESFMKIAFTQREIAKIEFNCQKRLIAHELLSDPNKLSGQEQFYSHEVMKRWTIKEAFLKYIGRGFNEKLKSVEVIDDTVFYNGKEFANIMIHSFNIDDGYLLSLIHDVD